jgi:anti-sigma factor RsiW
MPPSALAQERLRARARRINQVRRRVAAVSLATFALAFGLIAYDGSMGTTTSASGETTVPGVEIVAYDALAVGT